MIINIDINQETNELKTPWNYGINTCHAVLWTRNDLPAQAMQARDDIGFKYVRFHNIISRNTQVYSEDENGNPIINFDIFDKIYDRVLSCGYLPFFEIGFCPDALAVKSRQMFFYKAETSVISSFDKWDYLIKEIISHIIDRYGIECAKKWRFEVWNEPDIFYAGTMEDYFELYAHTVKTIKSVCGELSVGGPATSKCKWIKEFIEYVEKNKLPCDFISTHAYPSDLPFLLNDDDNNVNLMTSDVMYEFFKRTRDYMNNSSLKNLPLIMGEWNSSAGPFAPNHDEKNNAAFIIKIFNDLDGIIDESLYWDLSDIFEEQQFRYIPFHGDYGIMTINDIPKSSYNAFKLLNKLSGEKPATQIKDANNGCGAITSYDKEKETLNILMYNYMEPDCENNDFENIEIKIDGAKCKTASITTFDINDEGGSAYEWWLNIGSPVYPTLEILSLLKEKSKMIEKNDIIMSDNTDVYAIKTKLGKGDVKLISIYGISN